MIALKCKVHPAYRALQKPRVACFACWFLWKIREVLNRNIYNDLKEVTPKEKTK